MNDWGIMNRARLVSRGSAPASLKNEMFEARMRSNADWVASFRIYPPND
jgi:hypothetical protein